MLYDFLFNVFEASWQSLLPSAVRHAKLDCFLKRCFNRLVVAKALPLRIDGVYGAAREVPLPNEPLPVDLVLVFLGREFLSHLKNLNQFPHCESSPLVRRWMVLDLEQTIRVCVKQVTLFGTVPQPIY